LCKNGVFSDYSTEIFISWSKNVPDVPNVHVRGRLDFRDANENDTGDGAADGTPPLQGSWDI
jgi:hypothetical protein